MNTPAVRVLMIDDNADDYILARDLLTDGGGFTVTWAATSNGGLAALAANAHDVCLLDYRMGSSDGLTLFQKALDTGLAMPVVFLTGAGDEALDLAAVRSGAADYLAKNELSPALLRRVLSHAIERGKILSTLRASEEKFRAVFEDSSIGIALLDAAGAIRDVNPCFLETFRVGEAVVKGRPFIDLAHPDDTGAIAAIIEDLSRRGHKCSQLESRFVTGDGKALWGRLLLSALPYLDNTDIAAVAMVQDITARKQAEEERARLALFPERNPNPVVRLSAEGAVEFANAAAAPLLRAWGCAVGGLAPERLRRVVEEVYAGKAPRDIEVSWEGRIFSVAMQPVSGAGFVYLYGREVTEARRAEEELRMAAMVFEHTADGVMVTSPGGVILSVSNRSTMTPRSTSGCGTPCSPRGCGTAKYGTGARTARCIRPC
ncbi:MAG: PAS domain S-box protein [Nitrospinae bacterium]|nr:PAS domain S-box protein [Nitrospinota bacterium]